MVDFLRLRKSKFEYKEFFQCVMKHKKFKKLTIQSV